MPGGVHAVMNPIGKTRVSPSQPGKRLADTEMLDLA
jgi:hypothetical protein